MSGRPVWKKQNQLVEAEQVTVHYAPEGVEQANLGLSGQTCYVMLTAFGRVFVPVGTWIVYDEEGVRPVPQAVFERIYQPVTVAGRALALGERTLRKIIQASR